MTPLEDTWPLGPPGPRDHLVTRRLQAPLKASGSDYVPAFADLDGAEGPARLARHIAETLRREPRRSATISLPPRRKRSWLTSCSRKPASRSDSSCHHAYSRTWQKVAKVLTRLFRAHRCPRRRSRDLLVNAEGQPNIGSELRAELASADHVDLVCAFVIWSGVVRLRDALEGVVERGGGIRVITTTYMGATQAPAIDELVRLGAEVKVAFDARTTKLHAKAWLLERTSGWTTAFVGSSNLSYTALFDGLEWNLRLSAMDAPT